ncbi:follistatin-like [Anneissia japonica]|uniref:follistatin-like n=1 Tax=Anneissia japonica TaxID=1529436 RepID=UPI0014255BFF|nr:follistatin-like [Anneissia japonica]
MGLLSEIHIGSFSRDDAKSTHAGSNISPPSSQDMRSWMYIVRKWARRHAKHFSIGIVSGRTQLESNMKFLFLLFLLLLAVAVVQSSARRGRDRGRKNYHKQKNRPTNNNRRHPQDRPTNQKCSNKVEYVCGNDRKTYRNFCELRKATCTNTCLKFAAYGRCMDNGPRGCARCSSSSYYNWPYTRKAYEVCGTDGITYTKCELCRQKCLTGNSNLDVDYKGRCVSPTQSKGVTTLRPTIRPTTTTTNTTTPCRTNCPLEVDTVCGTDAITYPSRCVLFAVKCTNNPRLEIANEGPCRGDTQIN